MKPNHFAVLSAPAIGSATHESGSADHAAFGAGTLDRIPPTP